MIIFEDRLSDSPLVERVWRSRSERAGSFLSIAASTFEIVVSLVRAGLLVREPVVIDALRGDADACSPRTLQRRVLAATGLTCGTIRQIERARCATMLLRDGVAIAETVQRTGYYDQAHLTRSLRHRIGQTPGELMRGGRQLSFLYKTPWLR